MLNIAEIQQFESFNVIIVTYKKSQEKREEYDKISNSCFRQRH